MNNAKRFIKSSAVYFIGNVLTKIISIFLLRIYTGHLTTNDLGYYDVSNSYINVLIPVICMEIWSGIMRYMFDYKDIKGKHKAIFNGMVIFFGSVIFYTILFVVLGLCLNIQYLFLIYLYGLLTMLQNVYTNIARALGFNSLFAISGIISSLINACSNIIMILYFHMGVSSLYIALILGSIVQMIMLEVKVRIIGNLSLKFFDIKMVKELLVFSLPLCLNSACFWFLSGYNRIGITNMLGLSANGIYSVAGRFTQALWLVSACFSLAWQELVYSKANDNDKSELYTKASNYYISFIFLGLILLLPAVKFVFPFFVVNEFTSAFDYVPLYLLATGASIYSGFLGNIFGAEKKTGVIFISTLVGAIINVALLYLLVPYIGIQAANVALLFGFLANIILRIVFLKKTASIKLNYKSIALLTIIFLGAMYLYEKTSVLYNLIFLFIVCIVTAILLRKWILKAYQITITKLKTRLKSN